jgi:hypothetical protein
VTTINPEASPKAPQAAHPVRSREKPQGLPAMIAKRGRTLSRITIRLTPERAALLTLCRRTVTLFNGRPVSSALLIRRALDHYGDHLTELLTGQDREAQRREAKALLACRD